LVAPQQLYLREKTPVAGESSDKATQALAPAAEPCNSPLLAPDVIERQSSRNAAMMRGGRPRCIVGGARRRRRGADDRS
jgi:hypothetical protein